MTIASRRRALMGQQGGSTPILPVEYQQVEWIGGNGSNHYIDSGVTLTNDSLRMKAKVRMDSPGQYFRFICGEANASASTTWNALYKSSNKKITFKLGTSDASLLSDVTTDNVDLVIDAYVSAGNSENATAEMTVEENGVTSSYTGTFTTGSQIGKLWIFGTSYQKSLALSGRMYYCTVWNNGEKVFDGIPCYRKADGVIGLYDLVSESFKVNGGTGTFTKGADV